MPTATKSLSSQPVAKSAFPRRASWRSRRKFLRPPSASASRRGRPSRRQRVERTFRAAFPFFCHPERRAQRGVEGPLSPQEILIFLLCLVLTVQCHFIVILRLRSRPTRSEEHTSELQ